MNSNIPHRIKIVLIESIITRWKYNKLNEERKNVVMPPQHNFSLPYILNSKQIEFALALMTPDEMLIIERDFIDIAYKDWWRGYFSKATYYRIKNRAMDKFLNCLSRA